MIMRMDVFMRILYTQWMIDARISLKSPLY